MKKALLSTLGIIFLCFGFVGIVIPILPTTPFVILAATCFATSSPKLYNYMLRSSYFREYIENYKNGTGIQRATKVKSILLLWLSLGISAIFTNSTIMHVVLAFICVGVTVHICLLKTRA